MNHLQTTASNKYFLVNRFHVKSGVFKNNLWKIKKSNIINKVSKLPWIQFDPIVNAARSIKTKILENFYGPARRRKSADNFYIFVVIVSRVWLGQKFKYFGGNCRLSTRALELCLEHDWRLKHLSRSQPVSVLYGAGNSKVKTKSSKKKLKLTLHKIH